VVNGFSSPSRFLLGEVFGDLPTLRKYCGDDDDGLHLVFLFKALSTPFGAASFRALIRDFESHFPAPLTPTWVFGNHDRPRVLDRLSGNVHKAKLLAALQLTARGVPVIYYGDELGLPHHDLPVEGAADPIARRFAFVPRWLHPMLRRRGILLNRDGCRSPMPWHDGAHAGFSPAHTPTTWLPVHPASNTVNVRAQERDPQSLLACYRRLLAMRRDSKALSRGGLELVDKSSLHSDILYYTRTFEQPGEREIVHVALNFGERERAFTIAAPIAHVRSSLHDHRMDGASRIAPFEALIATERV
jgi:alpha-glucosidase